jgi:hypothetical protein
MKSNRHAPRMFGLFAVLAALTACAQPRLQQPMVNDSASPAVYSADRFAALERYAAQMEEIYASQEAEILKLRQEVASLRSSSQ